MVDSKLAMEIAVEAKSDPEFTPNDIGDHVDCFSRHLNLSGTEFAELVDEVERLIPEAKYDPIKAAAWRRASADYRAEVRAEQRAFCGER